MSEEIEVVLTQAEKFVATSAARKELHRLSGIEVLTPMEAAHMVALNAVLEKLEEGE